MSHFAFPARTCSASRPFLLACVLSLICLLTRAALAEPVRLQSGLVSGVISNDIETFSGLPYAAPPVGPLRWRAPRPPASWRGVRVADRFGPRCIQNPAQPAAEHYLNPAQSEDCLTLNVTRPLHPAGALPVMVWIHGGALISGASSQAVFQSSAFARHGIILVSFNYRLGPFGFFAHPLLTEEAADKGPLGNYGLMDEIAALKWVRANIAAFGGDPNKVTIFGQSAGGASVDALMTISIARGLFRAAIVESGYGWHPYPRLTQRNPDGDPSAETHDVALVRRTGYDIRTTADLRAIPAQTLMNAFVPDDQSGFILDGRILTEDLIPAFAADHEAHVPLLIGSTGFEMATLTSAIADGWATSLMSMPERARLLDAYTGDAQPLLHLLSDAAFRWQSRELATLHAAHGQPAYIFSFDAVPASKADQWTGAPHGAELAYVFDTLAEAPWPTTAQDRLTADTMNTYWSTFASTLTPEPVNLPFWPQVGTRRLMLFDERGASAVLDPASLRLDIIGRELLTDKHDPELAALPATFGPAMLHPAPD